MTAFIPSKAFAVAALLAAAPGVAAAATVAPGDTVTGSGLLAAGTTSASHLFDSAGPVRISVIALTASGASTVDLGKILIGIDSADTPFDLIMAVPGPVTPHPAVGFGALPSFISPGSFALVFAATGTAAPVAYTYTFKVTDVPLPAAGGLLAAVLAAGGLGARRRRQPG